MATSAISFGEKIIFVRDADLGDLLFAIACHLLNKPEKDYRGKYEWLAEACTSWIDHYESMAPGVRDIELDDWLKTPERLESFREFLLWLKSTTPPENLYNQAVIDHVVDRLEQELFSS